MTIPVFSAEIVKQFCDDGERAEFEDSEYLGLVPFWSLPKLNSHISKMWMDI